MTVSASRTLSSQTKNTSGRLCSRQYFSSTELSASGTSMRIKIAAHSSLSLNIASVTIGEQNSSASFNGDPTRITFNTGNNYVTVSSGSDQYSDWVAFALDETKNYLVHLSLTVDATNAFKYKAGGTEYVKYTSSDESTVASVTGYTAGNYQVFISVVEVEAASAAATAGLFFCHG